MISILDEKFSETRLVNMIGRQLERLPSEYRATVEALVRRFSEATDEPKNVQYFIWFTILSFLKKIDEDEAASYASRISSKIGIRAATLMELADSFDPSRFVDMIVHFSGFRNTTRFLNTSWVGKTPSKIIAELQRMEQEAKREAASNTGRIIRIRSGDKPAVIIEKGGNVDYVWWLLDRHYCSDEARAGGHCGNISGRESHRILSLRSPVNRHGVPVRLEREDVQKHPYWRHHLTFILDTETGMLGEMKGFGNQKPSRKYHDQIVELLRSGIAKGIEGGGYEPGRNFSLFDLDKKRSKMVPKDLVLGWNEISNLVSNTVSQIIQQDFKNKLWEIEDKIVLVENSDSYGDFLLDMLDFMNARGDLDRFSSFSDIFDHYDFFECGLYYGEELVEELIDDTVCFNLIVDIMKAEPLAFISAIEDSGKYEYDENLVNLVEDLENKLSEGKPLSREDVKEVLLSFDDKNELVKTVYGFFNEKGILLSDIVAYYSEDKFSHDLIEDMEEYIYDIIDDVLNQDEYGIDEKKGKFYIFTDKVLKKQSIVESLYNEIYNIERYVNDIDDDVAEKVEDLCEDNERSCFSAKNMDIIRELVEDYVNRKMKDILKKDVSSKTVVDGLEYIVKEKIQSKVDEKGEYKMPDNIGDCAYPYGPELKYEFINFLLSNYGEVGVDIAKMEGLDIETSIDNKQVHDIMRKLDILSDKDIVSNYIVDINGLLLVRLGGFGHDNLPKLLERMKEYPYPFVVEVGYHVSKKPTPEDIVEIADQHGFEIIDMKGRYIVFMRKSG